MFSRCMNVKPRILGMSDMLLPKHDCMPEPSQIPTDLDKQVKEIQRIDRSSENRHMPFWRSGLRDEFFPGIGIEVQDTEQKHLHRNDKAVETVFNVLLRPILSGFDRACVPQNRYAYRLIEGEKDLI